MGDLGDLHPVGEISPDQRVEDLGGRGDGIGRSRLRYARLTVDACLTLRFASALVKVDVLLDDTSGDG